jgi:hypothetical protein
MTSEAWGTEEADSLILHSPIILFLGQMMRDSLTILLETGKIPAIREITALFRFDGLDGAIIAIQENAFPVGFLDEG